MNKLKFENSMIIKEQVQLLKTEKILQSLIEKVNCQLNQLIVSNKCHTVFC